MGDKMKIKVGVSNRHVHLTKEVYFGLFGKSELEKSRDLDQPGQFASTSYVTIKKGDRQIEKVRVLGPFRNYNQVEISRTDAYKLKVNPPVRDSGDLEGSESITLIGPNGSVDLSSGLILAKRHIHITPEDMHKYGFEGMKKVAVLIKGEKGGIIDNVYFKVLDVASLALHLDTDEGNAFNLKTGDEVVLIKSLEDENETTK